jgi:hypothetical protein
LGIVFSRGVFAEVHPTLFFTSTYSRFLDVLSYISIWASSPPHATQSALAYLVVPCVFLRSVHSFKGSFGGY